MLTRCQRSKMYLSLCFISYFIWSVWFQSVESQIESDACRLEMNHNRIICTQENGIGEFFDEHSPRLDFAQIELNGVKFTNPNLNASWYNGRTHIVALTFTNCNIQRFHSDTFSGDAFSMMKSIRIYCYNLIPIYLESHSLGRLLHLDYIYIDAFVFGPDFDWGENRAITAILISECFPRNISFDYFLDNGRFPNLRTFGIAGMGANFHTLGPDNFQNLNNNKLQTLVLFDCGIEIILNKTFDSIGKYLHLLNLVKNKIKYICLEQFGPYLVGTVGSKGLYLGENPIVCDCDSLLVKSVYYLNFASRSFLDSEMNCRSNDFPTNLEEECPKQQTIRPNKLCIKTENSFISFGMENLLYPKFILKIEREGNGPVIRTAEVVQYKLLMLRYQPSKSKIKCPHRGWLQMNAKCWLLRNKNETKNFEDDFHRQSEFTLVSVYHLTYLRVWPLHLMAIRYEEQLYSRPMIHHLIWIMPCAGWLIGFICYISFNLWKSRRSVIKANMNENMTAIQSPVDDNEYYES